MHEIRRMSRCFGDGGAREHGEKVAAAEGEDAGFLRAALRREGDNRRHRIREFVGVAGIKIIDTVCLTVSQGFRNLRRPYPRLRILRDNVEMDVIEAKGLGHGNLVFSLIILSCSPKEKGRELRTVHERQGHYCLPTPGQYVREDITLFGTKKAIDKRNGNRRVEFLRLRGITQAQKIFGVKIFLESRFFPR